MSLTRTLVVLPLLVILSNCGFPLPTREDYENAARAAIEPSILPGQGFPLPGTRKLTQPGEYRLPDGRYDVDFSCGSGEYHYRIDDGKGTRHGTCIWTLQSHFAHETAVEGPGILAIAVAAAGQWGLDVKLTERPPDDLESDSLELPATIAPSPL